MTAPQPVRAGTAAWVAALEGLPNSATSTERVAGSVVVVTGEVGWGSRLRRAVDEGAIAIVVSAPRSISTDELEEAHRATRRVPVVVERPWLRPDLADGSMRGTVQVEVSADAADFGPALRDGIGWARQLGGGPLALASARATAHGLVALLETTDEPTGASTLTTVIATRTHTAVPWIRVVTLTADRTEVVVDGSASTRVIRETSEGRLTLPSPFEARERVALRRAIAAVTDSHSLHDLADLAHDSRLAEAALVAGRPG